MTGQIKERLMILSEAVEQAYDKARDADWDGIESTHLWAEYRRLKEKLDNGELYEPLF